MHSHEDNAHLHMQINFREGSAGAGAGDGDGALPKSEKCTADAGVSICAEYPWVFNHYSNYDGLISGAFGKPQSLALPRPARARAKARPEPHIHMVGVHNVRCNQGTVCFAFEKRRVKMSGQAMNLPISWCPKKDY